MFLLTIYCVNQKPQTAFLPIEYSNKTFQYITWYWNSRTVTEPSILSWINEETKCNRHIKLLILYGE